MLEACSVFISLHPITRIANEIDVVRFSHQHKSVAEQHNTFTMLHFKNLALFVLPAIAYNRHHISSSYIVQRATIEIFS